MRHVALSLRAAICLCLPALAAAQTPQTPLTPLTLEEAMSRARTRTPEARALAATDAESAERVKQARAGLLPRIELTESVQRGNLPVFVFGSLLSQRRFSEANFAIPSLNSPDPITNTRTSLVIEQPVFDPAGGWTEWNAARLRRELTAAEARRGSQELAFAAAAAFVRVLQLTAEERAAREGVAAAEADAERSRARHEHGVVTSADVLSMAAHLAAARERHAGAAAELRIARLQLDAAIGGDGSPWQPVAPAPADGPLDLQALLLEARAKRADVAASRAAVRLAGVERTGARRSFLPTVAAQAAVEFNGAAPGDQRSSWMVGGELRWNLFKGFADRSRLAAAGHAEARARAGDEALARRVAVEVETAVARLEAARVRGRAVEAAVSQAREAQRILRDRYDNGLATASDLLRAAQAVTDSEARAAAAGADLILLSIALDRAVGRL